MEKVDIFIARYIEINKIMVLIEYSLANGHGISRTKASTVIHNQELMDFMEETVVVCGCMLVLDSLLSINS